MTALLFIIAMGILGAQAGGSWGGGWLASKGFKWLPEALYALPFGVVAGWGVNALGVDFIPALVVTIIAAGVSYAGMQSGTWSFLRWESHEDPNIERDGTLKFIVDWLAGLRGHKLGDEGYAWIAAGVKGFIVGLPVGGLFTAVFWALGYELGSHAKGRVERFGLDPHAFSEFFSGAFGAISIVLFIQGVLWLI